MKFWKEPSNHAAFRYAKSLTKEYSKSFYISASLLPPERRWATYALYGFCRYADNLVDNPRKRSNSELLDEVHSFAEEIKLAYRTGESEHPILKPFIIIAKTNKIPIEYPLDLIDGIDMDIKYSQFKSLDDLYLFCYRVAGVVGLMMTHVLGYKNKKAFLYAEKLGIAMQLTNILRDIKEDKNMGRIYLPLDELRKFGVSKQDIYEERMSKNLFELMKFQVNRAHQFYEEAAPGIPLLNTESQFAIYSASKIYRGILYKIEAQHYNPFLGRVFVPQFKKFSILFQEVFKTKVLLLQERFIFPEYDIINNK